MSSTCVQIIQRCPYGSRREPARSPWNVSDGFNAFHAVPAITLTDQVILADTVFDHLRPTTFAEIEHGLRRHGLTLMKCAWSK